LLAAKVREALRDRAVFRRLLADEIEREAERRANDRTAVFTMPEGYRPPAEIDFEVESERGTTTVTVTPDGSVLADPKQGWVRFDGIAYDVAE
jgi:hypothetical protein